MKRQHFISSFLSCLLIFTLLLGNTSVLAAESNLDELFVQGMNYFTGDGVEQDLKKGSEILMAAAEAGSVDAMISLAYFCAYGTGDLFIDDYDEKLAPVYALEWFNKAAEAGDRETAAYAMIEVGYDYLIGRNEKIPEDTVAAIMFFEAAERLGVYAANNTLGIFYTYGAVVERDPEKALDLFVEGAMNGVAECAYSIEEYAYAYYAGTDEAIDVNFSTAFQYYEALTAFENPRAMYNIGLLYVYGLGVSIDRDKGIQWINKAANLGFEPAKEKLAELRQTASEN